MALFVLLSPFFSTAFLRAQDLAEAARQEQARKAAEKNVAPHVYTEEDLHRNKILTPEDQARVEARKKPVLPQQNAESHPADPSQQAESLGEIARRYRHEKEAREAERAATRNLRPFSYQVPNASLASPKADLASSNDAATPVGRPARPSLSPMSVPAISPRPIIPQARISPFQPRPLVAAPLPVRVAPENPSVRPRLEHSTPWAPLPSARTTNARRLQVRKGDSWWALASRYLGSGTRWRQLRGLNPEAKDPPERLRSGSIIRVPETPDLQLEKPQKHLKVKKGDTLWFLARVHLGRGSAWGCLANANPQITSYTHLAIGSVLLLPGSDSSPQCQNRTDDARQP